MGAQAEWLIDDRSMFSAFAEKFWSHPNSGTASEFAPFLKDQGKVLTPAECQELHDLTYLSDAMPFGKAWSGSCDLWKGSSWKWPGLLQC